jgi:hypothetical protein
MEKALDRRNRCIKYIAPVLPGRCKKHAEPFPFAFWWDYWEFEHIFPGTEDLCTIDQGLWLCGYTHAVNRRRKQDDISGDDLIMVDVHPITLYAFIELFTGITSPAGIDICFIKGDFLYDNVRVSDHTAQHPVKQRLGVTIPAGTSGKGEDFDRHSSFLVAAMLKKVGF